MRTKDDGVEELEGGDGSSSDHALHQELCMGEQVVGNLEVLFFRAAPIANVINFPVRVSQPEGGAYRCSTFQRCQSQDPTDS